jgi:hypothetical protein
LWSFVVWGPTQFDGNRLFPAHSMDLVFPMFH